MTPQERFHEIALRGAGCLKVDANRKAYAIGFRIGERGEDPTFALHRRETEVERIYFRDGYQAGVASHQAKGR